MLKYQHIVLLLRRNCIWDAADRFVSDGRGPRAGGPEQEGFVLAHELMPNSCPAHMRTHMYYAIMLTLSHF